MNFDPQQQRPGRRLAGMGGVVVLHGVLVYALIAGLQRTPNLISSHTVEVRLMDEDVRRAVVPPPPAPAPAPPTPATPRVSPPPPRAPAPLVPVAAPVSEAPAPVAPMAPAEPQQSAPTAEAPAPAPAPAAPAAAPSAAVVCPGYKDAIRSSPPPREVMLDGVGGEVVVEFTVLPNGSVRNPIPISSTNPALNRWAMNTVLQKIRCQGQAQPVQLRVPISVRFE